MSVVHFESGVFSAWIDGVLSTIPIVTGPFAAGSIPFSNGTFLTEDNTNLFWDDTANYLRTPKIVGGINTNSTLTFQTTTGIGGLGNDFIFLNGNNGNQIPLKIIFRTADNLSVFRINSPIWPVDNIALIIKGIGANAALFESQTGATVKFIFRTAYDGYQWEVGGGVIAVDDFGIKDTTGERIPFQILGTATGGQCIMQMVGIGTSAIPFPTGTHGLIFADGTALSAMGANTAGLFSDDVAGTVKMFAIDEVNSVTRLNHTNRALGAGATPTLGTIGGSGPTVAAQDSWMEYSVGGVTYWIPVWR